MRKGCLIALTGNRGAGRLPGDRGVAKESLFVMESSVQASQGFITPITPWDGNSNTASLKKISSSEDGVVFLPFQSVFQEAVSNVKTTQAEVEEDQYLLATGQLEDPHTLPIAESKAQISLDLLISLRNKAVESYNELLKMNV